VSEDDAAVPTPPEGFVEELTRGPFSTHNGPYFTARPAVGAAKAFFVLPRHCNSLGIVHGGMITSFLDGLLAAAVGRESRTTMVTIHLSVDFLSMARRGEWVMGESRVTRLTSGIAFAEGRLFAGEKDVARAAGLFKLMHRRSE
jgi:uncharacterized protein (TIGR00369 family)